MKKGLSFLLILVMLIGMMPIQVFATEGTQETEAVEVVTEPTEAPEEKTTTPAEDTEEAEPSKLYESEEDAEAAHEHDYEAVVTDPTCTEQGYTTYTCDCGDSYADDYVEPHSAVKVTDAAIRANSLRPGLTEGSHCSACGAVLEPQEEIPAKGYDWMLEDGEFKLLLIGNSFSQDASSCGFGMTESQLYNMLQAMLGEDVKVTLGLLYSGGKGVHWYATQTERGTKAPSFYTITPEKTVWTSRGGTSTKTAITWTDWDVVSLQPYDVNFTKEQEGVPEKYKAETDEKFYPLETATEYMLDFIGIHAPQADVYCYMHWARSSATVASLNASLSTYQKFAAFYPKGLDYLGTETGNRYAGIIPVGLSIQNARTTFLSTLSYNIGATVDLQNDPQIGLQRDGGHVTFNVGRYIAGLTFAEALIPVGLRAEGYVLPEIRVTESVGKLPEKYTDVAQKAVFAAVESWRNGSLEVTNLEGFSKDPAVSAREKLASMTPNLTCGDENALIAQIREKVWGELSAEYVVEAVAVDVEKNTALITLRFGYTSVEAEIAYTLTDHNFENGTCTGCGEEASLKGKTLSILGDSISTFANYSNGTAAQTTNSTIANGALYYPRSGFDVTAESTWWYQAAQELDMEILVNNSWSGSCLLNTRSGTVGAYVDRCVQLHDNTGENAGEKPDIIAVFLGTNDYYSYPGTLGSYEAINFDTLIQEGDTGAVYAQPVTSLEAYAISLHKISLAYPDAQVYCFTLLPRVNSSNQPTLFNEDICQLAEKFGAHTVDLYNCGIQSESTAFYKMMGDNLHPDNPGMDAITNAFVSELLKNSDLTTYDVSFALEGTVAMEGTSRTVVSGDSFETVLVPLDASLPLEVTVTMGGMDITDSCWADSMVTIPSVTADVVITAKPGQREPLNFRWETQADILVSVTSGGNTANSLTMTHGSITDGVFAKTRFTMSQGISLRHDLPWCVEWKSSGTWTDTTDGALLFAEANTSATADACYFYRRHKNDFFAFGSYTGGKYHNYGVKLSGTGIDTTAEHVFRLENRIASDGSNMIWLKVDGEDVGPLNHHYIGGTDQKETVDWVSGKDFTFSYMGTNPHTIGGCSLEYIQVWEKGHVHSYESVVTMPTYTDRGYTTYTCTECGYSYISDYTDAIELCSYRWEMDNNALVSVSANGNTANALTLDSGSVVDGILNKVRYTLQNEVWLYHDAPWAVEWCSTGNWSGMLLSSVSKSPSDGLTYLFRDPGSKLFAFGEYTGTWNNYGLILDCDMAVPHIFRLENRIAPDGTNMVYLLVDDEEVGAMHHHYVGGTNKNATVDWADGKDIVLRNIGTSSHPMSGMQLEYLHIWENGHNHSYQSAVTAPTCTEKGFTTYTCECGGSYVGDYVDAAGHTYENGICTVCGAEAPGPYSGKTIACIGDSITYGVGVTRDESDYVTLLSKSLEMDYIRLGASGTTLCTDGHATCNIGKLTEANLAGADVVTILMGINDFVQAKSGYYSLGTIDSTDTSTIYGATHMWCQRIEELRQTDSLKDTEFYFMTPVITSWNNSVSSVRNWDQAKMNIHSYRLRDLCNAIIEVCALYDIPVIDLNLISGLYYNSTEDNNIDIFGGDGAHPGAAGHQMMASAIENVLLQNHLRDDHDHCYGSWITTTYPDCVNGEQHRVCTICTATESKQLDGMGHTYENGICTSCGIVHTSTFQILDTRCNRVESFTYEVGMTWKEWLNSKYNTGMGSCIAIWVGAGPDILGYNPYMDIFVNGACVDYDDLIQEQDTIELVKYQ